MPSFSLGLAQVEQQLGVVRRRLNLLTLQDALYLSGSLVALAAALVVALALRGRVGPFAVALWAAIAAVAAALGAAALRIRRRWLSVAEVVHYADRQAALDDRLATLLSDPSRVRNSQLREVLLEQILAAAPRWDVDTLAPRRVPRSLFALIAALAVLAVTSFVVRAPATPLPNNAQRPHPSGADDPSGAAGVRNEGQPAGDVPAPGGVGAAMQNAGLPGAAGQLGTEPARGPGMPDAAGRGTGASAQAVAESGSGRNGRDGRDGSTTGESSARDSAQASRALSEKVQDAIRQALGADNAERHQAHDGDASEGDRDRMADAGTRGSGQDRQTDSAARKHAGSQASNGHAAQPADATEGQPGSGSTAAGGAHSGQATKELFGSAGDARLAGSESPNLAIKLGTFSSMAPSEVEPQRHAPPIGDLAVGQAGARDPAPLSEEQIPDAPLQKADVAPEHEALIRRIFTRDE